MPYDFVPTICAAVVVVFAINGITIYAVVKAVVLGRSIVERRTEDADDRTNVEPLRGRR